MTSFAVSFFPSGEVTRVFLDANVIAKPVTRTLLMVGGGPSGFHALWSETAEREATAHMRPRATSPSTIRARFGFVLGATGTASARFASTRGGDRQILADAEATGACFIVTEDVDDFGVADLAATGILAVNPDLFLAEALTRSAYAAVIDLFVERQVDPPTTAAQFHAALAKQHPRLFEAHAQLYDVAPLPRTQAEPSELFRGPRCLRCRETVTGSQMSILGRCERCRSAPHS